MIAKVKSNQCSVENGSRYSSSDEMIFSKEKIRIVPEDLSDKDSIAVLCNKERINHNLYYQDSDYI